MKHDYEIISTHITVAIPNSDDLVSKKNQFTYFSVIYEDNLIQTASKPSFIVSTVCSYLIMSFQKAVIQVGPFFSG